MFRGVPECGHWSLLIIDHTVDKLGRLVFLDSLPNMFCDTMAMLQDLLSGTPLAPEGCKWIHASMPRQGIRTMDCGVFMTCKALLNIKGLLSRSCLLANGNPPKFTDVNITFKCDAITLGESGHDHTDACWHQFILGTAILMPRAAFNLCSIEWSQLSHV